MEKINKWVKPSIRAIEKYTQGRINMGIF